MKKTFNLAALFCCSILSVSAQFSGTGSGTTDDPFLIRNAAQLSQMANFCGQDGVVFKLQKDIDITDWLIDEGLTRQGWSPVGASTQPFKGKLIGNGKKISGLTIFRESENNVGFFGCLDGATISDLTLECTTIAGSSYLGAFVGNAMNSSISNCHVSLSGGLSSASGEYVGGFMGCASNCTFSDCSIEAVVTGTGAKYVGGFGGGATDSTAINGVTANITVSSCNECVGGLLGYTKTATITNTNVTGNVTGTSCVAGFIAKAEGTDSIANCNYRGDLNGETNIGGISAYLAEGSLSTFTSCCTRGTITATGDYVGGIVGVSQGACIAGMESCSHYGDNVGVNCIGGLIGALLKETRELSYPTKNRWVIRAYNSWAGEVAYEQHDIVNTSFNIDLLKFVNVKCCIVNCNIIGKKYLGGIVGYESYGYEYAGVLTEACFNNNGSGSGQNYYVATKVINNLYLYNGSNYTGISATGKPSQFFFNYTTYYKSPISLLLSSNSFYGSIQGTNKIGGIVGCKNGGKVESCYVQAIIKGSIDVGGLIGCTSSDTIGIVTTIKSNVVNNTKIDLMEKEFGRIYGSAETNYITIGELGSNESNRASTKTQVILNGVIQEVYDDLQNGTSTGPSALKTKANYQAWGWDFDNDWSIIDGESWPYKKYQAAPPSIMSNLVSQETTISGKSLNGGTVYLTYNDQEPIAINCEGEDWSVDVEPLQSGATITIYAETDDLVPSYPVSYTVSPKGEGTEAAPYQIYTAYDLQGISKRGYYKLMNDIDLSDWILRHSPAEGWKPIGMAETPEMIHLDGNNHVIKGLWTNSSNTYNGLFANLSNGGSVKNLVIQVATGKKVQGGDFAGILAGYAVNVTVDNCFVKGDVETANYAGGLIGYAQGGSISKSYSKGSIKATGENGYAGGLVAWCSTPISNSYSTASVDAPECVAGLVGYSTSTIDKCYAQGNVTGQRFGAGLVAQLSGPTAAVTNSAALNENITMTGEYSSASRVLNGNINGCPDPNESNVALKTMEVTINGKVEKKYDDEWEGTGKTLETQMQSVIYENIGWDFTNIWGIVENETVPYLLNEIKQGDVNHDGQIDMTDAISIVYYYLGQRPKTFIEEAAHMNNDDHIDITDAIIIVYMYLGENSYGANARKLLEATTKKEPQ